MHKINFDRLATRKNRTSSPKWEYFDFRAIFIEDQEKFTHYRITFLLRFVGNLILPF